jgi:recombination protein RecR
MGALNPVDGTDLEHLAIPSLVERVRREEGLREVVIGTDPDAEGEATGLALLEALDRAGADVRVTRLARGLPAGSALEYLHRGVLEDALEGRVALRGPSRPQPERGADR